MKNILKYLAIASTCACMAGCMQEFEPASDHVSKDQTFKAPNAFESLAGATTSTLCGQFTYDPSNYRGYDFGYPAFFIERDVMGQDILQPTLNWWDAWYICAYLGPTYAVSQLPWTYYYGWIKNCNVVISMSSDKISPEHKSGLGIAYTMRALFYMDLARMYAQKTYKEDKNAETVPIITEKTTKDEAANNPRATNEKIWQFILDDLNKGEELLKDYQRMDKTTPDVSVVYGLKARAYQAMEDWANAKKYAKLAQNGYQMMNEQQYTDWNSGFNTPNASWMLCCSYKMDDPNIRDNDGDCSWASFMCLEVDPETSGCGYASNYGQFFLIDRHLFETIPESDFRKKCFVDFKIDQLPNQKEKIEALKSYTAYPENVYNTGYNTSDNYKGVGGLPLKFRLAGGADGRINQKIGFCVSVPMMRVEEMYLIEAEAAGMLNEGEGIALLEKFAKTRDAHYVYGSHNEAYGNKTTSKFQNEIWWQRRVELWGEGFATFDIKRLHKGIIRSYPNTNHIESYRWNTENVPQWMNLCIIQTETNYNNACTNNPDPVAPDGDSPEHQW